MPDSWNKIDASAMDIYTKAMKLLKFPNPPKIPRKVNSPRCSVEKEIPFCRITMSTAIVPINPLKNVTSAAGIPSPSSFTNKFMILKAKDDMREKKNACTIGHLLSESIHKG